MRVLWTDGSALPNPGKGGFAVIEDGKLVSYGSAELTTNIRMEGEAIYAAMEYAKDDECEIRTDSEFWVKVLTKWAKVWEARGWKTGSNKSVANEELVRRVWEKFKMGKFSIYWIRGHAGTSGNELADKWANEARMGNIKTL